MPAVRSPSRTVLFRAAAVCLGLVVVLGGLEITLRMLGPPAPTPQALHYRTQDGTRVKGKDDPAVGAVMRILNQPISPRARAAFKPGVEFSICYDGATGDWFDDNGCVPVRFNQSGVRERPELRFGNKPEGQKRIVCLGDSFTFGWGIREEDNWVRLLENTLRTDHDEVRTINCGAAGTTVVDEYRYGLEQRFFRFGPDLVLVTLCLNDLIPKNAGVGHVQAPPHTPSALLDRILLATHDPMTLDPSVDWVELLLALPAEDPLYTDDHEVTYEMLWPSGGPQQNLVLMRDWCRERSIPFGVILWPFLQGLGPEQSYPFEKLHRIVADFCKDNAIPFHDVLPALRGHDPASLWVHPTDWHPNPEAQKLALPGIEAFTRGLMGW